MKTNEDYEQKYKESYPNIETYLDQIKYALQSGRARINFQEERLVDEKRDKKYTNRYTMANLFPDEEPVEALKMELACLNEQEYIETVLLKVIFHIGKEVRLMKILKSERKLCLNCMEEHDVKTIEIIEKDAFKGVEVEYPATYDFCPNTNEYLETEEMIRTNSLNLKDAYRVKVGLLTSEDIKNIREKYGISQKDFSEILDWGGATITRYENHQVQDRAHDDILRKISTDPKWLLEILKRAGDRISPRAYKKYFFEVNKEYSKCKNQYLIDSIHAMYANFEDGLVTGYMELCLDKVVEVINYLSQKVTNLYKVKLMKMLWYSDVLNFKRHGRSITGLAYNVLPMGAVPKGYEQIMFLDGVSYDPVVFDDVAYKFKPSPGFEIKKLSGEEIETIDKIIDVFGDLNTSQIVVRMHEEDAYKYTSSNDVISYSFAEQLSIE